MRRGCWDWTAQSLYVLMLYACVFLLVLPYNVRAQCHNIGHVDWSSWEVFHIKQSLWSLQISPNEKFTVKNRTSSMLLLLLKLSKYRYIQFSVMKVFFLCYQLLSFIIWNTCVMRAYDAWHLGYWGKFYSILPWWEVDRLCWQRVSDIYFRKCIQEINGSNLKVKTSKRVKLQFQQTTVTDTK